MDADNPAEWDATLRQQYYLPDANPDDLPDPAVDYDAYVDAVEKIMNLDKPGTPLQNNVAKAVDFERREDKF
eukprot:CAMPEP_0115030192 /NCGR_PEP_ID=MMETSP0216-20121206/37586_1 /TAXON_ID=223996 /ORGANISM="Protocruzia adherens, Strain Boccale" /LENGTH=71 /DNA_ID=CAMNT_0002407193 /DNA_START=1 /DNA_END=216 /DNA_ORIENTATION=+